MKKRLALLSCCLALTMALCGCNGGHVHSFSDSYIEEPTCEEGGTVERVCSECGEIVTEEVPPLGHDWEDGVCMRCGRTESGGMMTLRSITVEGQKTEFTEADAAFTTGDSFRVIGHFETDGAAGETRALTAEEISVDAESMDAAFAAIAAGNYDAARGAYPITVQGSAYGVQCSTSYYVTLDHAWGDPVDGVCTCSIDGVQRGTWALEDSISVTAWGTTPVISADARACMASDGSNYMTYGSIEKGQFISISGTAYTTGTDTWDTPFLGIRQDENLFLARQDTWVMGADTAWNNCGWSLHPWGSDAVEYNFASTEEFLNAATDWEVYYSGTSTGSDWGSDASPVSFTITWEYHWLGYILISTAIGGGTPIQRYIKVPDGVYETALSMEDVTMNVISVSEIRIA